MDKQIITTIESPRKKARIKIILVGIFVSLFLLAGVGVGLYLINQQQDVREKASVATGVGKVFINPAIKKVKPGDVFTADILFDTSDRTISGVTVKLEYSYDGDAPPITATEVMPSQNLITAESWSFPVKTVTINGGNALIEILGTVGSTEGYQTQGQEKLATIRFTTDKAGVINVSFDPVASKMREKSTEADILLIPQSTGIYTAEGESQATATPTSVATPTATPSGEATPTSTPTPTPTRTPTPTPGGSNTTPGPTRTPTPTPEIPVTGIPTTTLGVLGIGAVLIIGSLLIAL